MRHLLLATVLVTAACGDEDPAPTVEILEVTPESLDSADDAADDLSIMLRYHDSDGDLGGGIAEIHDCRADGLVNSVDIPPIANDDAVKQKVAIEGMLELVVTDIGTIPAGDELPAVCADLGIDPPAEGEVVLCVVLTDAAGNTGLGDCTPPVPIQ